MRRPLKYNGGRGYMIDDQGSVESTMVPVYLSLCPPERLIRHLIYTHTRSHGFNLGQNSAVTFRCGVNRTGSKSLFSLLLAIGQFAIWIFLRKYPKLFQQQLTTGRHWNGFTLNTIAYTLFDLFSMNVIDFFFFFVSLEHQHISVVNWNGLVTSY